MEEHSDVVIRRTGDPDEALPLLAVPFWLPELQKAMVRAHLALQSVLNTDMQESFRKF